MMISLIRRIALVAALAGFAAGMPVAAQNPDRVIGVPDRDAEMNAAIASARTSLPKFWEALAHPAPGEEVFSLKVAISDRGKTEHFWLVDVEQRNGRIFGTINNTPETVTNVRLGQRYEFTEDKISDWMFLRNRKIVGNETMRPLLKRMTPAEAARFRSMLESP
jgi:uncharacterized protein YegJ (DUF2314 family)